MLSTPITKKESEHSKPNGFLQVSWASSCMQGWRIGMEDGHICIPQLDGAGSWQKVALFGVLDGHGGEQVAKFCQTHLPEELCNAPLTSNGKPPTSADFEAALKRTFHRMDELLGDPANLRELESLTNRPVPSQALPLMIRSALRGVDVNFVGCTACVMCVTLNKLIVANAGDSRAVLCRAGTTIPLSEDHKPNAPRERQRIEAAGGTVDPQPCVGVPQYRVNGNLNLSRAIGDLQYKQDRRRPPEEQIICSTPDVLFQDRHEDDEFVIICCDGVWDMMSNEQVVQFVWSRLFRDKTKKSTPEQMSKVLEELLDNCISSDLLRTRGLGGDNMTAVLVCLNGARLEFTSASCKVPQLISAICCPESLAASGGELAVRIAVPADLRLDDLSLAVSESGAKLWLAARQDGDEGEGTTWTFELAPHLQEGMELHKPNGRELPAKFFPKTSVLLARLPWRCKTN